MRENSGDPVATNPEHYSVLFENDRVRVLEYYDAPGDATTPHSHPDSVMVTLTAFSRRLSGNAAGTATAPTLDVELPAGVARWLPAQTHSGENTGDTPTHTIFVELKFAAGSEGEHPFSAADAAPLGPEIPPSA